MLDPFDAAESAYVAAKLQVWHLVLQIGTGLGISHCSPLSLFNTSPFVDAMADLAVNDAATGSRISRPRRGRAPARRYPIPQDCEVPGCPRCHMSLELRHTETPGRGGITWSCGQSGCYVNRRCSTAVVAAVQRMGPVQPCAICTEECDHAAAFQWPCHHAYHRQCVARYYARVPKPP